MFHCINSNISRSPDEANKVCVIREFKKPCIAFHSMRATTKHDLKKLETELKRDMRELEMRLTFKLASIIVIVVGLFTGLLGVFLKFTH